MEEYIPDIKKRTITLGATGPNICTMENHFDLSYFYMDMNSRVHICHCILQVLFFMLPVKTGRKCHVPCDSREP